MRIQERLRADCEQCIGFCCVALRFTTLDGFPMDKNEGQPCVLRPRICPAASF